MSLVNTQWAAGNSTLMNFAFNVHFGSFNLVYLKGLHNEIANTFIHNDHFIEFMEKFYLFILHCRLGDLKYNVIQRIFVAMLLESWKCIMFLNSS